MIVQSQLEQMGKEVTRPVCTFQIQVQIHTTLFRGSNSILYLHIYM
jgi:hypothetical protein